MITLAEYQTLPLLSDYVDRYYDNIGGPRMVQQLESDIKYLEQMDQAKGSETKESADCKKLLRELLASNTKTLQIGESK